MHHQFLGKDLKTQKKSAVPQFTSIMFLSISILLPLFYCCNPSYSYCHFSFCFPPPHPVYFFTNSESFTKALFFFRTQRPLGAWSLSSVPLRLVPPLKLEAVFLSCRIGWLVGLWWLLIKKKSLLLVSGGED